MVRAEAVVAAEHAVPAAEHRTDHTDRPAPADRHYAVPLGQHVGERADPYPGADRDPVAGRLDRVQRAEVEHQTVRCGVFGEAVPAAAQRERPPAAAGEVQRGHHVRLGGALDDRGRQHLGPAADEQLAGAGVAGVAGTVHRPGEPAQVGTVAHAASPGSSAYMSACNRYSSAYRPPSASSDAWSPCSATFPWCSR